MVHGGLLGRAGTDDAVMAEHGIAPIDLLVVNLYPFEHGHRATRLQLDDAIENIDIGGPAMLRAAAKNYARVAVATDPAQYAGLVRGARRQRRRAVGADALRAVGGRVQPRRAVRRLHQQLPVGRRRPTRDAGAAMFPAQMNSHLRQGHGPALRREPAPAGALLPRPVAGARHARHRSPQLQGKELSYNNLADADAALECVRQFDAPACVIVKHANPCGVAVGAACGDAYELAYATDPTSAFGGIIAFNRTLDAATAKAILDRQFVEVLIAPDYDARRAGLRAQEGQRARAADPARRRPATTIDIKRVGCGLLVQTADNRGMTARRTEGRDQARADRSAAARPAVRLEGGQVREVQRHRLRARTSAPSASAPAR